MWKRGVYSRLQADKVSGHLQCAWDRKGGRRIAFRWKGTVDECKEARSLSFFVIGMYNFLNIMMLCYKASRLTLLVHGHKVVLLQVHVQ
jgi:hypothetical protein